MPMHGTTYCNFIYCADCDSMQQAEKKIRLEQRNVRRQAFEDEIDRSCMML